MNDTYRLTKNLIEFVIVCINAFAKQFQLEVPKAYRYLNDYGGIDFLVDFYDIEHTLSIENAVEDLEQLCKNNGGITPTGVMTYNPDIQFQVECVAKILVTMLMERYDLNMKDALDRLYVSETLDRLVDPECGLYYESPVYVFSFLQSEIETGSLSNNGYI